MKYICIAVCPEMDDYNDPRCKVDDPEDYTDPLIEYIGYNGCCRCGNVPIWDKIQSDTSKERSI